jgi:glutathione S-transferase
VAKTGRLWQFEAMDFADSTLFISARSPFARRVRLAFLEHGVKFEEKVFDVFKPNPELAALNPLARVPTLRLADGSVLIESEKILEQFYRAHPGSPLLPAGESEQVSAHFWSGVALGLCERAIEFYMEGLRPEGTRDPDLLGEIRDVATRVLERFDAFIGERATIVPGRLTQADLDVGTALAYLSLRYSPQWRGRYSRASDYLQRLDERPSFQATRPPAPG